MITTQTATKATRAKTTTKTTMMMTMKMCPTGRWNSGMESVILESSSFNSFNPINVKRDFRRCADNPQLSHSMTTKKHFPITFFSFSFNHIFRFITAKSSGSWTRYTSAAATHRPPATWWGQHPPPPRSPGSGQSARTLICKWKFLSDNLSWNHLAKNANALHDYNN